MNLDGSGTYVCHMDEESMQTDGNIVGDRSANSSQGSEKVKICVFLKYSIASSFHIVSNVDWI